MARLTFLQISKSALRRFWLFLLSSCSQATYILNTLTLIPTQNGRAISGFLKDPVPTLPVWKQYFHFGLNSGFRRKCPCSAGSMQWMSNAQSLELALELSAVDQHEPDCQHEHKRPRGKAALWPSDLLSSKHGTESSSNGVAEEHPGEARHRR